MRKAISWGLVLFAIGLLVRVLLMQGANAAELASRPGLDRGAECRYGRSDGRAGYSTLDVRRVIRCAVGHWSVPGGYDKAIAVAACESGADLLDHSTDGYTGTFQQATRYWTGRRATYNPDGWAKPLQRPAWHPRANVVVSIRMAHSSGWAAWEQGACA